MAPTPCRRRFVGLMWAQSARSQVVTGAEMPARRLANSREIHRRTALRSGVR